MFIHSINPTNTHVNETHEKYCIVMTWLSREVYTKHTMPFTNVQFFTPRRPRPL